jgi:hypothetical protein
MRPAVGETGSPETGARRSRGLALPTRLPTSAPRFSPMPASTPTSSLSSSELVRVVLQRVRLSRAGLRRCRQRRPMQPGTEDVRRFTGDHRRQAPPGRVPAAPSRRSPGHRRHPRRQRSARAYRGHRGELARRSQAPPTSRSRRSVDYHFHGDRRGRTRRHRRSGQPNYASRGLIDACPADARGPSRAARG